MENKHNWFITHTGRQFDLANINANNICLEDIAHHLTNINRYGGAMKLGVKYSVAQHSILLCEYARDELNMPELARELLMHDATEAYLGDVVKGLKNLLPEYERLEAKLSKIIKSKYGVPTSKCRTDWANILDRRILLNESKRFTPKHYELFEVTLEGYAPLNVKPKNQLFLGIDFSWFIKRKFLKLCKEFDIKD